MGRPARLQLSIAQVLLPAVRELLDARRNVRAQVAAARRGLNPAATSPEAAADSALVADSGERSG